MWFPELRPCLKSVSSITFSDFADCSGLQRQPVCIHPRHTHVRSCLWSFSGVWCHPLTLRIQFRLCSSQVRSIGSGSWATPALSPVLSHQTMPFSAWNVLPTHTLQCPLGCGLSPPLPTALFSSKLFFIFRIQIACHLLGTHLTLVQCPPNWLPDMEPSRCRK